MDTTFGNTVRMAMYMMFVMYLARVPVTDFRMMVTGDDTELYLRNSYDNPKFLTHFKAVLLQVFLPIDTIEKRGLGQIVKVAFKGDMEDSVFCSTNAFFTLRKGLPFYRIIRMPHRVLATLGMKESKSKIANLQWLKAVAQCNLYWAKDLPIFGKLFEKIQELTQHVVEQNVQVKSVQPCIVPEWEKKYVKYYTGSDIQVDEQLIQQLGVQQHFAARGRITTTEKHDYEYALQWMMRKFHITREEIVQCELNITRMTLDQECLELPGTEKFKNDLGIDILA
jgi:hypothetical protein